MLTLALSLMTLLLAPRAHGELPAAGAPFSSAARPDFSGTWTFDQPKSMEKPGPDGRVVLAAMLGEEFIAKQDATMLTLTITSGGQTVTAVYHLAGRETRNISPGNIAVMSQTMWDGRKFVIRSTSAGTEKRRKVTIRTRRVIWLDPDGYLVIERTGTPASLVTPSRSVYRKSS